MSGSIHDVDAQRARWVRHRTHQGLTLAAAENFALGGLGRHADRLDARILFLPSDPDADAVPLDKGVMEWLKESRTSPAGGSYPSWGHRERATSGALVLYDQVRDDGGWTRYLALHQHGGVEVGISHLTYEISSLRVFGLRQIVGLAWAAAALQAEAVDRWKIAAPFELTVGIRNTNQATLGGFAEGWANPGHGLGEFHRCLEDHVLLRREVTDAIDPQRYALNLGDQLERAFGSVYRRHLARIGEYEGRFDPR